MSTAFSPQWLNPGASTLRLDFDQERRRRISAMGDLISGLSLAVTAQKDIDPESAREASEILAELITDVGDALRSDDAPR